MEGKGENFDLEEYKIKKAEEDVGRIKALDKDPKFVERTYESRKKSIELVREIAEKGINEVMKKRDKFVKSIEDGELREAINLIYAFEHPGFGDEERKIEEDSKDLEEYLKELEENFEKQYSEGRTM